MTVHDIFARFQRLRLWSNNGRRAPNKPLLALWAIGRCLAGEQRMAPFALVDRELGKLLRAFGPPRKATHTEYPFWRMRNDGVWEVDSTRKVAITKSGDARRPSLLEHNVHGGLLQEDYFAFRAHPIIAWEVADMLIEEHFPDSYRDDVLRATGFVGGAGELWRQRLRGVDAGERTGALGDLEVRDDAVFEQSRRRKRHPGFRPAVLRAYRDQCAVCGLDIRMADVPIVVEAAHIHWLKDAGPSNVCNGIALCVLHHRLFDRGAFTVVGDFRVVVATHVAGAGLQDALGRFNRERLQVIPEFGDLRPHRQYLSWHAREVFRAPGSMGT